MKHTGLALATMLIAALLCSRWSDGATNTLFKLKVTLEPEEERVDLAVRVAYETRRGGTMRITARDDSGKIVGDKTVRMLAGDKAARGAVPTVVFRDLPYGLYDIEIAATGFKPAKQRIRLDDKRSE